MNDRATRANPFPGLRPFQADETHLFFGRDEPTDELIQQLGDSRFLAVVGVSGSGKSSLVQCGVLPALYGGFLTGAGSSWRVAILRPGHDPIGQLARALSDANVTGPGMSDGRGVAGASLVETVLRRGAMGAVDAVRQARLDPQENLLIVVDQFEELFRFKQNMAAARPEDEAAAFLKLLLEAGRADAPIYVMLTMRSDFLGDCAQFRNLPEAINDGLYLIPRMTRGQQREAIEGPVAMGRAEMTPRLVQRLLNDVGDNPDQLPILQHALKRTWDHWAGNRPGSGPIDLPDYVSIGGMAGALNMHADEVLEELTPHRQEVARRLFQSLIEKGEDNRPIRRPATVSEICGVAQAEQADVIAIIEAFRQPGRTFLMPPAGVELEGDTLIDISHESLIRIWTRLGEWVEEESQSARIYRRLSDTAALAAMGKAALYRDPDLQIALDWQDQTNPTESWAKRYDDRFDQTSGFLRRSERIAFWRRWGLRGALAGAVVLSVLWALRAQGAANRAERARTMAFAASRPDPLEGALILAELQGSEDIEGNGIEIARDLVRRSIPAAVWSGTARIPVRSAAFDTSGTHVLIVQSDGTDGVARLLSAETGEELEVLPSEGTVSRAAFLGGSGLAIFSTDGWLRTVDGARRSSVPIPPDPSGSAVIRRFSEDGSRFAEGARGTIRLWMTGVAAPPIELDHPNATDGAFSPDGLRFASWSSDADAVPVSVWDIDWAQGTARELARLVHRPDTLARIEIAGFAFNSSGDLLVTAAWDGIVRVWDATATRALPLRELPHIKAVNSVAFDRSDQPGERVVTSSEDGTARIWDAETGEELHVLSGHDGPVQYAAFSPDGTRVLTTSDSDHTARIWDAETGRPLRVLEGHGAGPLARFSPDGSRVITADNRGEVRVWRADGTRWFLVLDEHPGPLWAAALSTDATQVATAGADGAVRIWDSRTGQPIGGPLAHDQAARALAFSPDGSKLATASGNRAFVWTVGGDRDTVVFTELFTVGHDGPVRSVAFSADGARLLTTSNDGTARLWEGETGAPVGEPMRHEEQVYAAAFGPDGRIATGSEDWAGMWSATGEFQRALDPEEEVLEGAVYSVAFSPDGRRLVTAAGMAAYVWDLDGEEDGPRHTLAAGSIVQRVAFGPDNLVVTAERGDSDSPASVIAWNAQTGDTLYSLGSHAEAVQSVALTAHASLLATASKDGTARVWPMDWEGLLLGIREYATHACLTVAQREDLLGESNQAAENSVSACRDRHQTTNGGRKP